MAGTGVAMTSLLDYAINEMVLTSIRGCQFWVFGSELWVKVPDI